MVSCSCVLLVIWKVVVMRCSRASTCPAYALSLWLPANCCGGGAAAPLLAAGAGAAPSAAGCELIASDEEFYYVLFFFLLLLQLLQLLQLQLVLPLPQRTSLRKRSLNEVTRN